MLIARRTDLAERRELLPAGDQAAASGNAVTFARHLGPFDDGLRGMYGRRISFVCRPSVQRIRALNRYARTFNVTRHLKRHLSRARAKKRTNFTLRPASLLCRFIRLLPCSRLPLLKLRSRSRTSTNACVNLNGRSFALTLTIRYLIFEY